VSVHQVHCPGRVLLLDSEIAELDRVPGGLEVPRALWCELESGHPGRHAVEGQFAGGPGVPDPYTVWVRWPDDDEYGPGRELVVLPTCPVSFLEGHIEEEGCGLYEGHPGRHGWEFGPPLTAADLPPDLSAWLRHKDAPPEEPDK
jgi:hypothetical protein